MIKKIFNNEPLIVLLYTMISMLGTLIIMKILALNLSKEDFGVYSLILSLMAFITIFPFKGIDQANGRYVSINRNENKFTEYYSNYIFFFFLIIVIYGFIFISADFLDINLGIYIKYLWIIFAYLVSEVIKITLRTIIVADRKRIKILLSNSIEFGLKILFLVIFSNYMTIKYIFLLFILVNFLSSINLFLENKNDLKLEVINKTNFLFHNKRLWLFAYPFMIMAVFTWARDMSNRWIIDFYLDKESVAIYSVLTSISLIIPMGIQTILSSYIVPIIYQKENVKKGFARRVTNVLFIVLPVIFIFIAYFIDMFSIEIITIFSSSKYIYNSWALTLLFLSYSTYTLAMYSIYEILANNQSKLLIKPSIISGVLSIISGLILIKICGLNGAIYSYMIGYISYALFIYFEVIKYRRNSDYS